MIKNLKFARPKRRTILETATPLRSLTRGTNRNTPSDSRRYACCRSRTERHRALQGYYNDLEVKMDRDAEVTLWIHSRDILSK